MQIVKPDISMKKFFVSPLQEVGLTENETAKIKRVAVIGASGFLGKKIYDIFKRAYPDVIGTCYSKPGFSHLDATNEEEVRAFIEEYHPDAVIYAAGEAEPECVERNLPRAMDLNANAVDIIGRYFKGHFVYISTDYIFDGITPPYDVNATPCPLNEYGRTKMIGEKKALSNFENAVVVRCGMLFGYNSQDDKLTFVKDMVAKLDRGDEIVADNEQIRHPVLTDDVANFILTLVQQGNLGIFQINGNEGVTEYELSQLIADVCFQTFPRSIVDESVELIKGRILGAKLVDLNYRPRDAKMVNSAVPTPLKTGIKKIICRLSSRLKGGSYSRTFKLQRGGSWIVRKEAFGEGRNKLIDEIKWLLALPEELKSHFPEVLNYDLEFKTVFYEMPFYNMPTLTQWVVDEEISVELARKKLERVLHFYGTKLIIYRHKESSVDYVKEFLIKKINNRLEETRRKAPDVFNDLIKAETLIINGKRYKNVLPLIKEIASNQDILLKLHPPYFTLIHGDLHFDNILINGSFILLDNRGDLSGDPIYDIAKILHTIVGKYDILNYDLHRAYVKQEGKEISINIEYPIDHPAWQVYASLEEQFPKILMNSYLLNGRETKDRHWLKRLLFTHASLFASDMPFHLKGDNKEERAVAIYATGVMLLNEFLSFMQGKSNSWRGFLRQEPESKNYSAKLTEGT